MRFFSKPKCSRSQMGSDEVPFTRWELDEYYDPNPDTSEPRNTTALIFSKRLKTGEFHRFPSKNRDNHWKNRENTWEFPWEFPWISPFFGPFF